MGKFSELPESQVTTRLGLYAAGADEVDALDDANTMDFVARGSEAVDRFIFAIRNIRRLCHHVSE